MKKSNSRQADEVVDENNNPITHNGNSTVMNLLTLGAGLALLVSAGKSRSSVGGLLKGGAATALLGQAAKSAGLLGSIAGLFSSGSPKKHSTGKKSAST